MSKHRPNNSFIAFSAPIELQAAAEGKPKKFSMVAYTGGAMQVGFSRPVVVDLRGLSGLDVSRPALLNHDFERVVGHIDAMKIEGGRLVASGVVSGAGAAAAEVVASAANGFPWQASIGARIQEQKLVEAGASVSVNGRTFQGPLIVATKSRLGEISFVALGADENTSAKIAAKGKTMSRINSNAGDSNIANHSDDQTDFESHDPASEDAKEAKRIRALTNAANKLGADGEDERLGKGASASLLAKAIDEGWSVSQYELAAIRASRPKSPAVGLGGGHGGIDQAAVLECAFAQTMGVQPKLLEKYFDQRVIDASTARDIRGAGIHTLIHNVLRASGRGEGFTRVGPDTIALAANAEMSLRADGFSTLSVPGILSNTANKLLLQSYNAVPTTWQAFCSTRPARDFKTTTAYRMTMLGELEEVAGDGEIQHGTLSEASYTSQVSTYGKMFVVSRQDIINDDLGALQAVPLSLGMQAAKKLEKLVYKKLLSNPGSFFSSGNKNYLTGGSSALGSTGLQAAETKFLQMVDDNGDPILATPQTLLVPPELKVTAAELVNSTEKRNTTANTIYPTGNPFANSYNVVVSPWLSNSGLTGNSATAWYLLCAPSDAIAAMTVAFLNGVSTPTVESQETSFNTLGISMRVYFDFGVSMFDPKSAVKSTGA